MSVGVGRIFRVRLFVYLYVCIVRSITYKYKYKWEFVERGLQIVQGR